jgi:hypothetical protein
MRRAKHILCTFLMMCTVSLAGQTRSELREMFVSAEGDILFEDYAEALPKYLNLLKIYPDNYNFYFRVGQCYLNTPGEKDKSISFLETAARNIDPGYRKGRFRETGAPFDALYLLANAYHINNDLDKALETYSQFMKDVDTEVYDTALVRFQMETCLHAREMMKNPVCVVEKNLGSVINERFSEFDPVMSSDECSLLFTRELPFYDAVFWSTRVNGSWTEPINLTPQLGIDQDYYTSSLADDGKILLLYRTDTYDGNIYMSRLNGDRWTNVERLNDNINTKYWESHAVMTKDGSKLYFTSNRRESLGGLDIFVSERDSTGDWGPAVNLGPVINTVYNEETPFLANNDHTLFFSSRGHYNMGGYDIFRSDLDAYGQWSTPVNLGYPVNTTDDDLFFMPLSDGYRGLYSMFSSGGYGRMDIYSYEIYSDRHPREFVVTGKAVVSNLLDEFPQAVTITALSDADPKKIVTVASNPVSGLYSFRLPHGSYTFTFASDGALPSSERHEMPITHDGDTVYIDPVSLSSSDLTAYLKVLADSTVSVTSSEPVNVRLAVEDRSILNIEVMLPDTVTTSERHRMLDTTYTFTLLPHRGRTMVMFSLTDRFGNRDTASIAVIRSDLAITARPLYHEIPVRPRRESATTESIVTDTATTSYDTIAAPSAAPEEEAATDVRERRQLSGLWWLALIAALIIAFIIWRNRKKKKPEKE